ncbi:hypothetical protein FEM33_07765 [Dyadobacter flavalbus]|uniref:Uncharacterized protein n=1 Tax=Dyadobacter flavalbus TaxID=2579942 RepID=A0A5M8QYL1_9BACT|nr:hypothetical protein [Dyadobacter flavalbus]KAA6440478.1 hypothetical protein FEM33_07765 [Dyadobacter flavalbus]
MSTSAVRSLAFIILLFISSCTDNSRENNAGSNKKPVGTIQAIAENVKKLKNGKTSEPVEISKLKMLLAEKLGNFSRIQIKGEKSGAAGFLISTAEARYKGKNDQIIRIEIIDTGGIASTSTMTLASRAMAGINSETASGHEKTTDIEGHKAFEKYDNTSKTGVLNVMVAERFLVNAEGENISINQLKDVINAINLSKLNNLK